MEIIFKNKRGKEMVYSDSEYLINVLETLNARLIISKVNNEFTVEYENMDLLDGENIILPGFGHDQNLKGALLNYINKINEKTIRRECDDHYEYYDINVTYRDWSDLPIGISFIETTKEF